MWRGMWRGNEKVRRECVEGEEKKSGVCGRGKEGDREVFDLYCWTYTQSNLCDQRCYLSSLERC